MRLLLPFSKSEIYFSRKHISLSYGLLTLCLPNKLSYLMTFLISNLLYLFEIAIKLKSLISDSVLVTALGRARNPDVGPQSFSQERHVQIEPVYFM